MGDGNRGNLSHADEHVNAKFAAPLRATRKSKRPGRKPGPFETVVVRDALLSSGFENDLARQAIAHDFPDF